MTMSRVEHLAEGVTLYLGDCRDILPTLGKVDAVVTDPVWPNCPPGTIPGSDNPLELWSSVPAHLRCSGAGRHVRHPPCAYRAENV